MSFYDKNENIQNIFEYFKNKLEEFRCSFTELSDLKAEIKRSISINKKDFESLKLLLEEYKMDYTKKINELKS